MRKMIQWVMAATLVCGMSVFTSCSSDDDDKVQVQILDFKVAAADWEEYFANSYETYVEVPQITKEIFEHGNVSVSMEVDEDSTKNYFSLPAFFTDDYGEGDSITFFNKYYDFVWREGLIVLSYCSDDAKSTIEPEDVTFRVFITNYK